MNELISVIRTSSENADFLELVRKLDQYLAILNGSDHNFYSEFNKPELLNHAVLLKVDGIPMACGAMKPFDSTRMELKRMFTLESKRRRGYASAVLNEIEKWTVELGYFHCILETGVFMPDAMRFYENSGYQRIANYPPYEKQERSACFQKAL